MDTLKDKQFATFDYISRYTSVPFYYDTLADRYVYGIGANMSKDTEWTLHKVTQTDNLDKLALKYYNNPSYWWVIAYFNDIQDAFIKLSDKYTTLKIPSISQVSFETSR